MRLKRLYIFLFLITILLDSLAQEKQGYIVSGGVTDSNGSPLAGATVSVRGTGKGVLTSMDGTYIITGLPAGTFSLKYSFVGYEAQEHSLTIARDTIMDIIMVQATLMTDEVIIKATRAGEKAPLAYTNVSQEVIARQNTASDIPFLLSLTPSLVETSEAGNGVGYTSLRIRGTDASRINVTIDGIPLNDAESQQVFWVDLPDLASSVDNIQVQRGVGTSSNGAGAFGASINIQTKGIEIKPFTEINSSAGLYRTLKNNLSVGTGLLKDKIAFQMRYSDIRSDGFIERTSSRHTSAFLSGIWRTESSMLKANILLGREHTGIGWWGVPPEMLAVNRRYNPAGEYTDENGLTHYYGNESDNYTQNHYQLIYTRKINKLLSFHTGLHYTKGDGYYEEFKEDLALQDYGLPDITIGGSTITRTDLIQRKWLSNDFYGLIYSLNYRNKRIDANIGGGFNLYSGDHFGRIIWMQTAGNTGMDHQWYLNKGEKGEINVYVKADYEISRELTLFGDLQYRFINYRMKGPDDDLKVLDQDHNFNFFNPKAGLFYSLAPGNEAYISISVANREPSRADFKEAAGDPEAMPRPERLYDIEGGYKLKTGKNSFGVNLYGMIYKDQLVPTGELSNVGYPITTNVAESYRTGVEFYAGILPLRFIDWNFNFTISRNKIPGFTEYYVDYSSADGSQEYKSRSLGTVDIAYSPSVTGSSDLTLKLRSNLNLHFISKYVGKQFFDNTMSNARKIDPYLINNIRLDFEPLIGKIRGTDIQLLVNNVFNLKYESNAYGGNWYEDGTEKTWSYYFPQAGTNIIMRLSLKF